MKKYVICVFTAAIVLMLTITGCSFGGDSSDTETVEKKETGKTCTETYTKKTPYNETEFYYEEEGVGRKFCDEIPYTDFTVKVDALGKVCNVYVTNTGDITDEWGIKVKFITTSAGGGPESEVITKTVAPGKTEQFSYQYDQSDVPRACVHDNVVLPTIEECKYSFYTPIKKSRVVTKYTEEEATREVPC